jgi:hypothetical protein
MRRGAIGLVAILAAAAAATPAWAGEATARDVQAAVDGYLASSEADAALVGGPGSAGYDAGFWIRGGDFLLRINLTLQARFEAQDWDDPEPVPGGDLSGYSLPRATVKLSGEAPCDICWYLELEFGHPGVFQRNQLFRTGTRALLPPSSTHLPGGGEPEREGFYRNDYLTTIGAGPLTNPGNIGPYDQTFNFDNSREAWIEWCSCPSFNVRMGQIKTPNTRQLMTPPELQQFIDVSLASAWVGQGMPGYTDRNRDHGVMVHGSFGCENDFSYMLAVTNGDGGDSIRNVLDDRTDDNLAYSARVNWAFLKPIGYEEGALRQMTCEWYGEVGAWVFYHADRIDKPHTVEGDVLVFGVDLALGYGGFSFTGAFTVEDVSDFPGGDASATSWLAQVGYLFPGTAWEVAARIDSYATDPDAGSIVNDGSVTELAFALNYYLNGHGNKLSADVAFLDASDEATGIIDFYTGYGDFLGGENSAILLRFQWQLAL